MPLPAGQRQYSVARALCAWQLMVLPLLAPAGPGMIPPYPSADGNIVIVRGKPIDEQGDEGFFGTSCMPSNQERSRSPPSNPRLDGG